MNKARIDRLLIEIASGSNVAFEKLYVETSRGLYSFLYSYFQNRHDTEDALQEVYLKVKLNISSYRAGTNGNAWLLQVAKNHALNVLARNSKRQAVDVDSVNIPVEENFLSDGKEITQIMSRVLTTEEQQILILHILWSYKHREIGELLNCPTGTITSKYKRAIKKMKESLKRRGY